MGFSRRRFLAAVAAGSSGLATGRAFAAARVFDQPALLAQAKAALDAHRQHISDSDLIGLVDFSLPSKLPRFQIVDMVGGTVLTTFLVAHGRGSDPANTGWLQHFSNRPGSNASSAGSFITANHYYGKHGASRRLQGVDPENSNAASRAIVIHGADYVSRPMARSQGRVGRSLGCFSVSKRDISQVLSLLGPGRLLFAGK
jgi:hypothetical protein